MTGTRNIILCILWCLICTNDQTTAKTSTFDGVIDLKCNNNLDCTIHGSVCTDNACQCLFGFIFNEQMTSCIEVARYGEKCVESSQCSRYLSSGGSCVNNVCLCSEGYYYIHGRCNAYTGLLQKCNKDDQCYVHADFNAASCQNGTCRCSDGFYQREYRTCRPEGKKVGDACTINNDCRFSHAVCDGFQCTVPQMRNNKLESSYDTSYFQQSDVVKIEADTNKTCTVDADCKNIRNSICGFSKMCTCNRAYFFMENIQQCVPELGEACSATDEVNIDNSECRNGIWTCEAGRVISVNNQQCEKATRKYGGSCQKDTQCSIFGPDALCKDYQCICNENSRFIESELFCWKKRGINEMCQHDRDCHISNINITLLCKNVCSCPDGTHANSDRTNCIADAADLGTTCEVAKDCATENAACKNGVCVCEDNYYQSESQCLPGVNATCASNEDCKPEKSQCLSERCSCEEGYVAASTGLCVQIVTFGEPCEKDVQCSAAVTGAVCSISNNSTTNGTCACIEGYHNRFNKCFKRKVLGMACDTLGECYLSSNKNRVVCKNGECACDWGYERQNGTTCETSSKTQVHINGATTKNLTGLLSVLLLLANILLFD